MFEDQPFRTSILVLVLRFLIQLRANLQILAPLMVWTVFSSHMMSLPSFWNVSLHFFEHGLSRSSVLVDGVDFFDAEMRVVARPWLQQLFWLVYFDSRSWLIFFWFVFGPHLWKCSPSSADSVLCWREVENRIDDKPEVALTFIDRKYENSVEYGRTSGGKLVLLVVTAKLFVSCTFRRVLWNSFSWCGLVLFHRNHVFRSFRPTRDDKFLKST